MSRRYQAIAEYYDAEYASNDVLDNDVPFLLSHLPKKRQRILELAAGTARAAIPLAQAGHRVTAVEIDADMLEIARRKRDGVGLKEQDLTLVRGDVLKLKYDGAFDWAVLVFNTLLNFTTLPEQDKLMRGVHAALKSRGRFWIDIFNPDYGIIARDHAADLDVAVFYVQALDRSVHRTTEVRRGSGPQLQHVTFHYGWADDTGEIHAERVAFDMTWMSARELTLLLNRNGFAVERLSGDYDGSEVSAGSPRIIVQARKLV